MRVQDVFAPEEIRRLAEPSDARGLAILAGNWALVAAAFALYAAAPSVWTALAATVLIAGRQLGLSALMHECAHKSLFKTKWMNDALGQWLCAYPVYVDTLRYRAEHLLHHKYAQTERDPDLWLTEPFPTTRRGLLRKFARDFSGVAGLRRVLGLTLINVGYLEPGPNGLSKADRSGMSFAEKAAAAARGLWRPALFHALFLAALWTAGHPELFLLWWAAYLTVYSFFLRVRAIAEHAVVPDRADPWRNTRTTRAGPLGRLLLAPNRVNYHLEHHLIPNVPCWRLPEMHAMLRERGALERSGALVARSYAEVLRLASSA